VGAGDGYLFGALQEKQAAPVLICHGETPQWMAAQRWRMLFPGAPPPNIAETFERFGIGAVKVRRQFRSPDGSQLWWEESCEGRLDDRLRRTVMEHHIGLVVIDPWATFYTGAENSNDEVEAAVAMLRRLAEETGAAIVVIHHLGKAQEGRDPEDLWRGASRLADAASTRVTLLPRFTTNEARERGLSPEEARRYARVRFLRREEPTPGFTAYLGHDGWWTRIEEAAVGPANDARRLFVDDVVMALQLDGGEWPSLRAAVAALGRTPLEVGQALARAKAAGEIREVEGPGGARRFLLADSELS
jgi:hypothetical protein